MKSTILTTVGVLLCVFFLAGCLGMSKVNSSLQSGDYDTAIRLLREMLQKEPGRLDAKNKLGLAYLKAGRTGEAVDTFQAVLRANPGDPYATLYLGMAFLRGSQIQKAMAVWQTYNDAANPRIGAEILRQLTFLQIYQSHQDAKKALEREKKMAAGEMTARAPLNTIAICDYKDLSPQKDLLPFSKALAAMLAADLSKDGPFKIVERTKLQALIWELKLGQSGVVDQKTAPRVGKLLGARNLVTGSLAKPEIQAVTQVTGDLKGTDTTRIQRARFFFLSGLIAAHLRRLAGREAGRGGAGGLPEGWTRNHQALYYYGLALAAFDQCRWKEARAMYEKALQQDPKFTAAIEGLEKCPPPRAPSCAEISRMTAAQAASVAGDAVASAVAASAAAAASSSGSSSSGGAGGACFPYDTLVRMADGSLKKIVDVRVGDAVLSHNPETGENVARKVVSTPSGRARYYVLINGQLRVTPPHPFYTAGSGWVRIKDLGVGDVVRSVRGEVGIVSIEKVPYDLRIYNIEVEGLHNFYVTANGRNFYLVGDGVKEGP